MEKINKKYIVDGALFIWLKGHIIMPSRLKATRFRYLSLINLRSSLRYARDFLKLQAKT